MEDQLHILANLFIMQFDELEPMSLDEFLVEYETVLTFNQLRLGKHILTLFEQL